MLKRIYINNFRCFVNFELQLGREQLILGLNGTGKSTLLDALSAVRELVTRQGVLDDLFPESCRTRWTTLPEQTFELEVELEATYRFELVLVPAASGRTRIQRERVLCDGQKVFDFSDGNVQLFDDSFAVTHAYPFDPSQSALATIQTGARNSRLMRFKDWIEDMHCLRLNPLTMSKKSEREEPRPRRDLSNFSSWYRYMAQEHSDAAFALQKQLHQILPGFAALDLPSAGANVRILGARFATQGTEYQNHGFPVAFDELSDGQRVLICLYALLHFVVQGNATIFLDEPENFIAIPEIQPWLMELRDRMDEKGGQVILLSHHPEIINYLAPDFGLVFERTGTGPVRIREYESGTPLSPAEEIARGWSVRE